MSRHARDGHAPSLRKALGTGKGGEGGGFGKKRFFQIRHEPGTVHPTEDSSRFQQGERGGGDWRTFSSFVRMGKAKNGEDMRTWGKLVDQDSKDIFPLKGETVVVGRQAAHCGIVLTKPYVSGKHFSLKRVGKDGGEVLLTDLSSNGTFRGDSVEHMVAGKLPVKGSDKLLHLDFVGIGCQTQDFLTLQVAPPES